MRERLKQFFRVEGSGLKAPARLFWVALAVRLLYMTLAHTYKVKPFEDHLRLRL